MKKKRVVIIGAGPAGLTAGYYLLKHSDQYEVVILEQDNLVGGISKTVEFSGYRIDTGIHRFFTKNDEVEQIWEECLPLQGSPAYDDILLDRKKTFAQGGPDPEKDDKTMLIKDRITKIYYGRKFYDYPVHLNMTTICNMGFFTLIKATFSYFKACIFPLPNTSLENFYINRFGRVLYGMFFESYTEKVWGVHPSEISADWGSQRVKGLSIRTVLKDVFKRFLHLKSNQNSETSLIESFIYPKLGAGYVYEEMAHRICQMGGKVILGAKVSTICGESKKISRIVYQKDGKEISLKTDVCISSMPICYLFSQMKGIEIPHRIYQIATKLPYREFMSVGLVLDQIHLENHEKIKTIHDVVPYSWIYVQEPDVKMGRIQIFNNWSPYLFKDKTEIQDKVMISLEYFCSCHDQYWKMSDQEFIDFAIDEAIRLKIIDGREHVLESVRIKVDKAYPAYFGTYDKMDKVVDFLNHIPNLYCIGRNGQHRYNNMDHSMLTGIETAKHILDPSLDKKMIWEVNTEKDYHEEKKS